MAKVIRAHVGDAWISGYSRAHARASIYIDLNFALRCERTRARPKGHKQNLVAARAAQILTVAAVMVVSDKTAINRRNTVAPSPRSLLLSLPPTTCGVCVCISVSLNTS